MKHWKSVSFAIATFVVGSTPGRAATLTTFDSRATFDLLGLTDTVEDFTPTFHFPIASGVLNSSTNQPDIGIAPGALRAGVTYSAPVGTGFFFNIDAGAGYIGGFLDSTTSAKPLTITFDKTQSGFGFDTRGLMRAFTISITTTDGLTSTENFIPLYLVDTFYGFQSIGAEIVSVQISGSDKTFGFDLDNFSYDGRQMSPVPLPASAPMFGAAVLALGLAGYGAKRRKAAAAA